MGENEQTLKSGLSTNKKNSHVITPKFYYQLEMQLVWKTSVAKRTLLFFSQNPLFCSGVSTKKWTTIRSLLKSKQIEWPNFRYII
jgi:hypothetical protein